MLELNRTFFEGFNPKFPPILLPIIERRHGNLRLFGIGSVQRLCVVPQLLLSKPPGSRNLEGWLEVESNSSSSSLVRQKFSMLPLVDQFRLNLKLITT
jgi:hypothetical protein